MNFELLWEVTAEALLDSLKLLPFLFVTYLLMEWLEHRAAERVRRFIAKSGLWGPLLGGAVGLVPQCGFSAAAAGLYAGRVVSLGTLIAVFLATSDEMIPVLLGGGVPLPTVFLVLGIKLLVAVAVGIALDLLRPRRGELQVTDFCQDEHCHCEEGILRSALHHTLHVFVFVLIINFALGLVFSLVGTERLSLLIGGTPLLREVLAALIGLVPNCAASVALATLYTKGVISLGTMTAGLLTGAGAGLLVLFRTNRSLRENVTIASLLFGIGVVSGIFLNLII